MKEAVIKVRGSLSLVDHNKVFYFYSKCSEKQWESFRQGHNIVKFMFLKDRYKIQVCNRCYVISANGEVAEEL